MLRAAIPLVYDNLKKREGSIVINLRFPSYFSVDGANGEVFASPLRRSQCRLIQFHRVSKQ